MGVDHGGVFIDALLADPTLVSPTDDYVIVGEWTDGGGAKAQIMFRGSADAVVRELRKGVTSKDRYQEIYTVSVESFCETADHIN